MDNKNNIINIAYCTDANYLEYVAVSIMSVIMNNPEQDLSFFVFVYDVTDEEINKLRSTSDKIQVINIDKEEIEKYGLDLFGVVPSDELIYEYDSEGIPLVKLPADSKSRVALEKIIETLDLP